MMKTPTVQDYLRRKLLRQALVGFFFIAVVTIALTYTFGALKFATDLEETGKDLTKAFRAQLLEGEIKVADAGSREPRTGSHATFGFSI